MSGMERLDLDGHGGNLDPVDDWHVLDDPALAATLAARGVDEVIVDRLIYERDDPYVDGLVTRFLQRTEAE